MTLTVQIPPGFNVFSDDELFAFCQANPELRIERDEHGHLLLMPPTGLETSFRNNNLALELGLWNRRSGLGRVSDSNGGYTLPDGSMRAPDAAWIAHERLAQVPPQDLKKFAPVCPDFVIELLSESDRLPEVQQKMQTWLANGVRLGWLLDPGTETAHVYRPGRAVQTQPFSVALSGQDVLPGFTLIPAEVLSL
jgi:Uma2 family endonuclease